MKVSNLPRVSIPECDAYDSSLAWFDVRRAPFKIHGVFYDDAQGLFVRMDQSVANAVGTDVKWLNRESSGGRVSFRTNSRVIAVRAVIHDDDEEHHTSNDSAIDLLRVGGDFDEITFDYCLEPPKVIGREYCARFCTECENLDRLLQLPLFASVHELYVGLSEDADIEEAHIYRDIAPVVFYGSSITQGARASRPSNTYQSMLSKKLKFDYTSLGFGGNARGEREIAEYIASLDMSIFVLDYDHNAPNAEHLLATHEPFFRVIRDSHPELPIIIMSAPNTMPWYDWCAPRRDAVRATYESARARGDENVYFIDGSEFFGEDGRDLCTVDTCHPNDLGMYRIACRLEGLMRDLLDKAEARG